MASFTFNYDSDNESDIEYCTVYNKSDEYKIGGATTRSQTKRIKLDDQLAHSNSNTKTIDNSQSLPNTTSEIASKKHLSEPHASPTFGTDQDGDISGDETNEPRSSPEVSTDKIDDNIKDQTEPMGLEPAATEPLKTSSSVYDQDTIVLQNDLLEAHIYRAFHRHQKIFQ